MVFVVSLAVAAWLTAGLYFIVGWRQIAECMAMWFRRDYWTDYNVVEFAAWIAKAIIIVPALVFDIQIWQLHFLPWQHPLR